MNAVPARSSIEFEVKRKMEERTEWRGQNESQIGGEKKRSGRLTGAAETSKERAEWRRFHQRNLNILCLLKRKEWPQCHRESSWQLTSTPEAPFPKGKRNRAVSPEHEIVKGKRDKVGESRVLAREKRSEREHGEKRVESTVIDYRFQGGKRGQARRASFWEVEESMNG